MFDHGPSPALPAAPSPSPTGLPVASTLPFAPAPSLPFAPRPTTPPPPPPAGFFGATIPAALAAPTPLPFAPVATPAAASPHPFVRRVLSQPVPVDSLPQVLMLPHPMVRGFALLNDQHQMVTEKGDPVSLFPTRSVIEAFGGEHDKDEHLTLYTVEDVNGPTRGSIPRLTKSAVAALFDPDDKLGYRQVLPGIVRVSSSILALDFDLPEHVRWTADHREQVQRILAEAGKVWAPFASPSLFYATNGGLRLVWFLTRPVDVRGAGGLEDLLHGLVASAYMAGVLVDLQCRDWTRLFRLPRVVRADKPAPEAQTWRQAYFAQSWGRIDFSAKEAAPADGFALAYDPDTFTALSSMHLDHFAVHAHSRALADKWKSRIGRPPRDWVALVASIETGSRPLDDQVQLLLHGDAESQSAQSAMYRQTVARLRALAYPRDKNRTSPEAIHAYKILEEQADIRDDAAGKRQLHGGVMRLAQTLCFSLRDRLGEAEGKITPQVLYALMIAPARLGNLKHQAEGQKVREDTQLCKEVWDVVTWFYPRYRSQVLMAEEEERESEMDRENLRASQLAQIGAYQEAVAGAVEKWSGGFDGVDDKRRSWIQANWQRVMIVKSRGGFAVMSINPNGTLGFSTPVGVFEDLPAVVSLCNHDLIPLSAVDHEGKENWTKRQALMRTYATMAEDITLSRIATSNCLKLLNSSDGRITPIYVEALPGIRRDIKAQYDPQVDQWLYLLAGGTKQAAEELMDWLAAFPRLERPAPAMYIQGHAGIGKGMLAKGLTAMTERNVSGRFDHFLTDYQDGLEKTPFIWTDESVTTKNVTSRVLDTFKMIVTGEANSLNRKGIPRISLDGNWRMLITSNHDHAIPWDEEVSGADLAAVTQRLHHLHADDVGCQKFLDSIGQHEGTAGWVEHRIPQHVMYLSQTRALKTNQRLLTQPVEKEFHKSISVSTGYTRGVAAMVGKLMLGNPAARERCIQIKDEEVYILPEPALDACHEINRREEALPKSTKDMSKCLKQLAADDASQNVWLKVPPMVAQAKYRTWRLDMTKLILWLHNNGGNCDLRPFLGEKLWKKYAPTNIYDEFKDDHEKQQAAGPNVIKFHEAPQQVSKRRAPPPPPPPSMLASAPPPAKLKD